MDQAEITKESRYAFLGYKRCSIMHDISGDPVGCK